MRTEFIAIIGLLWLAGCKPTPAVVEQDYTSLEGKTMGTYYRVTYADSLHRNLQELIDVRLAEVNQEVSTYIDSSLISRFNQASGRWAVARNHRHFVANFLASQAIFSATQGAFDPTVMPLVNYWGFGYTPKRAVEAVDSMRIDSLMQFVGFRRLEYQETADSLIIRKPHPGTQLDFSAIAKGYGVDEIGRLLESQGVVNYLVDIGGEVLARGHSPRGDAWQIGINQPKAEAALDDIQTAVPLQNRALATSGNYRNFYEVDGVRYSHTINPFTGFPQRNTLLSASVFAKDCMTADAYATACMVMGVEGALALTESLPDIEGYFIYSMPNGEMAVRYTHGLDSLFAPIQ